MSADSDPMSRVREGMTVVDADSEEIGTVATVQMGDPQAVTDEGQGDQGESGLLEKLGEALVGDLGISPQAAAQLRRTGYLKVDSKGLATDMYASAEQVADVTGDTVRLTVGTSQLYS